MNWVIRTNNLGKQYTPNGDWALQDISIEFPASKFIALIGHNGAGKSTFFHLLSGILDPTEGSIEIKTHDKQPTLGWCSQFTAIDWYLSVFDNVCLGARLAGFSRKQSNIMTKRALELVGLQNLGDRNADQLSGGQQQRIQIARALLHNPQILLLDEPTTGLDPVASDALMDELTERVRNGVLVIVSSHDLSLLQNYCDLIMFVENGKLVAFESREKFLEGFAYMETIIIHYEGEIEDVQTIFVESHGFEVTAHKPLKLTVKKGTPLNEIVSLLDGKVNIINVQRQPLGLREAYVNIMQKRELALK